MNSDEKLACTPRSLNSNRFNPNCILPYGLKPDHIQSAMQDFLEFLGFINQQLHTKDMSRLESFLMPANFSSIVGEYMNITIPKYCPTLVKNQYHNGHPDLIPVGVFPTMLFNIQRKGLKSKAHGICRDGKAITRNQCGSWFSYSIATHREMSRKI